MRLLLVEDDQDLSQLLKRDLKQAGYAVDIAENGIDAEFMGDNEPYDAIVLDLGLPGKSGIEVLKSWRKKNNKIPVIVLTARNAWNEKVEGFKAGADDYLGKPFHKEELEARIGAILRRLDGRASGELEYYGLMLDEDRQILTTPDKVEHELTGTEFRLLRYFLANPGKVLSKSRITEHVYDYDSDKDSNVIEVYVKRLRKFLGPDWIKTRRGQGYVFNHP